MTDLDLSNLPSNPGCYQFKNDSNKIIYIGKAKNLKKRIKSYFQKTDLDPKTQVLVGNIASFDFIVTDNEVEALVLENNLIKKHQPKFNIDFKDSRRYAYLEITKEAYPRLLIARNNRGTGKYFGPFVSAGARNYISQVLKKTFQIRTCKKLPKRTCLRFHINLCQAPCVGNIAQEDYLENMRKVELILRGKTGKLVSSLKKEMKAASKDLEYEYALERRNQIEAIQWLKEKQHMERNKRYDEDIINYIIRNDKVYLILFNVYKGTLENKQEFEFEYNPEFLEEFIVQYYSENNVPRELILPETVSDSVTPYLKLQRDGALDIKVPRKGAKKKLLELVNKNIEVSFFGHEEKLTDLKVKLNLEELPYIIECFDISHLSGTSTVGSMVQFRGGLPDKNNYRRFKIKSVEGVDDTAAISEVVRRRYTRLLNERTELPNLVIIDGGAGQLNSAIKEQSKLGLRLPIISIAKKFEEIYLPGRRTPLRLSKKTKALQLIQQIRDEAHRFALKYNRLLRKKEMIK